jgi:hypothetical protein
MLMVLTIDVLTVKYISKGNHAYDVGSVRTGRPVPRECPIYYYEISVLDPGVRGYVPSLLSMSYHLLVQS